MKNMKRALSLVLAMVMMLGMLTIPTGAAGNFTDGDQILNSEAVAITHGMGLFAGYPDGSFNPKGTVTRAQMAVIIVKMLYGSDFDANSLRGTSKFPDVSNFEGGWAEGWINACSQLGVVAGYEDGTFRPGKEVTTAEAVTMIINALKVNPGEGTWPDNYLAKAEEMDLYGDMKVRPGMRTAINRDQLAVLAWEGLDYSSEGVKGYTVGADTKVFATWKEAADYYKAVTGGNTVSVTAINEVKDNLAKDVFGLKKAEGFVIGNQATGAEVTLVGSENDKFNIETGLDMIGHKVTVYYKEAYVSEKQPGTTYCVIDETTAITVDEDVTNAKEYKAAFDGARYELATKKVNNQTVIDIKYFDSAYEPVSIPGNFNYVAGTTAPRGTYIVDEDSYIVAYIEPAAEYASYVVDVNTSADNEGILISGANNSDYIPNNADSDKIVEYTGIKAGDFVIYQQVRDVYTVTKVNSASGTLTRKDYKDINGDTNVPVLTIGGTQYAEFPLANNYTGSKLTVNESELVLGQDYKVYFTSDGRYIGFDEADASVSADMVFLMGKVVVSAKDGYGKITLTSTARGVDLNGKEVLVPLTKINDANGNKAYDNGETFVGEDPAEVLAKGFYTIEDAEGDAKKEGLKVVVPVDTTNNGSVYAVTYTGDTNASFAGTGFLSTSDGKKSLTKSSGNKYLFIDGTYDQDTPLVGNVLTDLSTAQPEMPNGTHMLVKRAADDATNEIQLIVFESNTTDNAVYSSIYVTQSQLDNASQTANGFELEAYVAKTGKMTQVDLETLQYSYEVAEEIGDVLVSVTHYADIVPGFYGIREDEEGKTEIIRYTDGQDAIVNGSASVDDDQCHLGMGYTGMSKGVVALLRKTGGSAALNALINNAVVIDVRSEDEIAASGVSELTSMSQISSMKENNLGLIVVMDVYGYASGSSDYASVLYVTDVIRESPNFDGIVYASESPYATERTTKKMVSISSNTRETGYPINVTYDKCDADATGFYKYVLNSVGELELRPVAMSANYGQHNTISEIADVVRVETVPITATVKTQNYGACDCGSCSGSSERMDFKITESTRIFDADGNAITLGDVITLNEGSVISINYYCGEGDEADLVYLYTNERLNDSFVEDAGVVYLNHNDVVVGGNKIPLIVHYVDGTHPAADEKGFLLTKDVTVNPDPAPGKGAFYQLDANGNLSLLGIDSGVVAYHNFFESYVNGTLTVSDETEPAHASGEHQYGSATLDFTCAGEDAGILTLTSISANLPVVGLAGVTNVTALQEFVTASGGGKRPIVSYYVVGGTIEALFVEEVAEFYVPADGELIYVAEYLGVDNDGGIVKNAYILSGEKAGEKVLIKYAAAGHSDDFVIKSDDTKINTVMTDYCGDENDTFEAINSTGFFYVADVDGSEITLTTGTAKWLATVRDGKFAGKVVLHRRVANKSEPLDQNTPDVLKIPTAQVLSTKTEHYAAHGSGGSDNRSCGTLCYNATLFGASGEFVVAKDAKVIDMRPETLRRADEKDTVFDAAQDITTVTDFVAVFTKDGAKSGSQVIFSAYMVDGVAKVVFVIETTPQ